MIQTFYFHAQGSVPILGPFCGAWGGAQSSNEFTAVLTIPRAGTLRNLRLRCLGGGVISNGPIDFHVRLNGVNTPITMSLAGGSTSGEDLTHTAPAVAGDQLSIGMTSVSGNCPFLTELCVDLDDNP
jgi:hypothetical protein